MKRSLIGALCVIGGAVATLAGCNGGTYDDLLKAPVAYQRDAMLPRAQVTACITNALSGFGSDLGRFPEVESGIDRLVLGGNDSGHFRSYYQINIEDEDGHTHVAVRQAKAKDPRLSLATLANAIERCTG